MSSESILHSDPLEEVPKGVWYANIAAYFERSLTDPVTPVRAIGQRRSEAFSTASTSRMLFSAIAQKGPRPAEDWRQLTSGSWEVNRKGRKLTEVLDGFESANPGGRATFVLLTQDRRGSTYPGVDYLWCIDYEAEQDFPSVQKDTCLVTTLRLNDFGFNPEDFGKCRDLVEDIARASLACPGVYYLLVDVSMLEETGAEGLYVHADRPTLAPRALRRYIEARKWERLRQERRAFVRGAFWGNYLSPAMLDRLGGKEDFRRRYMAHAKEHLANILTLVQDVPSGGLFVKISRDPLDEIHLAHPGLEMALWLHNEFQRIGALL